MARTRASRRTNVSGQHDFARIPSVSIPRSTFNRSCGLKTTFDAGFLVPIFIDEALPGDTMQMSATTFARMATPLHPIMDNMRLDIFFFAVPLRLLWDNFQKFCGEQENPGDSTSFVVPQVTTGVVGQPIGSLWDYFGLPLYTGTDDYSVSALWHRAYNRVWSEWFRDENLQDSVPLNTDDGPDANTDYGATSYNGELLLKRGKRHDYFTSCLPWPQKGTAVELPLGSTAPLTGLAPIISEGTGIPTFDADDQSNKYLEAGPGSVGVRIEGAGPTNEDSLAWSDTALEVDLSTGTGVADLSSATAATINQIREAFQIQRLYERDARGGTRYTEILRSHFGVVSPDMRLQRPEYLGGGSSIISINPVAQTSGTVTGTDASEQGNLAAFALGVDTHRGWIKSFTEHCVILGLACARADLNYQRKIARPFKRSTRWDFYWPALAHLGEQTVLNEEIYYGKNDAAANAQVFGYQERWAEYRYKPSEITGKMRSPEHTHTTTLDTWHLAQTWGDTAANRPLLNEDFIEENPPVDRVIAVDSEPHFLMDCWFSYKCTRPMPTYSVPGHIDRF